MDISTVVLIVFAALTAGTVAVGMLVRDLAVDSPASAVWATRPEKRKLRRMVTVHDKPPAKGLLSQIDQGFDYLLWESGVGLSPEAGFLFLVACGLSCGGTVFLYTGSALTGVGTSIAGMVVPLVYFAVRRHRRMTAIRDELPQVLEMLSRAVRAGQSIDQAVRMVGEEIEGPLGHEFSLCSKQLEMGRAFPTVFKSLAARVRLLDMRILTTTLIVQRQTGGNLAETLERMSGVIKDRMTAARQMRAATGAGRTSTLLIAIICPASYAFMFMFMPQHMEVFQKEALGQTLLMMAIALEVIGVIWVMSLMKAEE